jgi:hypothetical protein
MALFLTEYASLASDTFSTGIAAPLEPSIAEQAITLPGTSAAFNSRTAFVMVHAQEACCLAWGTAPTATTSKQRIGAGETRFVGVPAGAGYKVAVVAGA